MAASTQVRAAKFAQFVDRALRDARARGMTIPDIAAATGVSSATLYRWRAGDWTRDPRASWVRGFCEGLGLPIGVAYRLLGWTEDGEPQPTEPADLEPDMHEVARRLRDPNVPETEKLEIRAMIRYLARRRREAD